MLNIGNGKEGRIEGAVLKGRMWMVLSDTEKPEDPRKVHKTDKNNYLRRKLGIY